MLYICVLSNKFDLKQTIRVLHTLCQLVFYYNYLDWLQVFVLTKYSLIVFYSSVHSSRLFPSVPFYCEILDLPNKALLLSILISFSHWLLSACFMLRGGLRTSLFCLGRKWRHNKQNNDIQHIIKNRHPVYRIVVLNVELYWNAEFNHCWITTL